MNPMPSYDLGPVGAILLIGIAIAGVPLLWSLRRSTGSRRGGRLRALTWATLFLTFDLVLFGAFTRLTDSGLGCPDWPGCYGTSSPQGASRHIDAAEQATPTGPVTRTKAWIEMVHRYLATAVGALIVALAAANVVRARRGDAAATPRWAIAALAWVCLQGAFGALTVTMKLYPAIVTLHLLGGIGLLVLLALQLQAAAPAALELPRALFAGLCATAALVMAQIALGGWVSTNYAVLACRDFPTCQGSWWPVMDFAEGFNVQRGLGQAADGGYLPFSALTAIHQAHRLGAAVVFAALALLAWRLLASGGSAPRRAALALVGIGAWQLATGLGNVLLGWPLAAAVAHTGGAAALAVVLALLLGRSRPRPGTRPAARPAAVSLRAGS